MLTTDAKANFLFKEMMGVETSSLSRQFFEENPLDLRIWAQEDQIPNTAPVLAPDGESGVVKYKEDLELQPVPGAGGAFYHDDLADAIHFNFGDRTSYLWVIKDSLGEVIPFGYNDWVKPPKSKVIFFVNGAPANTPITISFYKYIGTKGVGGSAEAVNYFIAADTTARDAIPSEKREEGTLCFVQSPYSWFQLIGGVANVNWTNVGFGGAILTPQTVVLNNNDSGTITLSDKNTNPNFKLKYKAVRGSVTIDGEIDVLYDADVDDVGFIETISLLIDLGVTIDVNVSGDYIILAYTVDDNVDNVNFEYIFGLVGSNQPPTTGDMLKSTYDPTNKNADAFSMNNMVEGANTKIFTAAERTKLAGTEQFTTAEKVKLSGIEVNAEANQTNAEIKTQYEANPNTNVYTDAEKTKLAGLESSKFLGQYTSLAALQSAHPSPVVGAYGYVDLGAGNEVAVYVWDSNDNEYVKQLGESAAETAASIKTKYESNPDTNAFTDVEKAKLSNVEENAVDNDHIHLNNVMVSDDGTLKVNTWRWTIDGTDLVMEHYNGSLWNEIKRFSPA